MGSAVGVWFLTSQDVTLFEIRIQSKNFLDFWNLATSPAALAVVYVLMRYSCYL